MNFNKVLDAIACYSSQNERLRERVTTRDQNFGWSRGCNALSVGDTEETRDCGIKNDIFFWDFCICGCAERINQS